MFKPIADQLPRQQPAGQHLGLGPSKRADVDPARAAVTPYAYVHDHPVGPGFRGAVRERVRRGFWGRARDQLESYAVRKG